MTPRKRLSNRRHARPVSQKAIRVCALAIAAALYVSTSGNIFSAHAAPDHPVFELPADCIPGADCTIQNYFDTDPGPGAVDYSGGRLTYDNHRRLDIRIANLAVMENGVTVLAAAPGRVRARRDGMADVSLRDVGEEAIRRRECGNGVLIDHGGGWESQYCHLKIGSVAVRVNEMIERGRRLGLIGMSGRTEFPHVHFEVRHDGVAVDPFGGDSRTPLFSAAALAALDYDPTGLLNAGFATRTPRRGEVLAGAHQDESAAADSPSLVLWAETYGVGAAMREHFRIIGPDGAVLLDRLRKGPSRHQARRLAFMGIERGTSVWPAGRYLGEYVLERRDGGDWIVVLRVDRAVTVR